MKKLLLIVVILFLVACSSRISGQTTTICTNAPGVFTGADNNITIEGNDEDIRRWTEQITLTREQLTMYLLEGAHLTDNEIIELFEYLNTLEPEGSELRLASLRDSEVVIEYIYDYTILSHEVLSNIWGVDDFERDVTLSSAIRGLERKDAVCYTN